MVKHSVQKCLEAVGVLPGDLESSKTLDREFKVVKKAYFRKVLTAHPDKGGDPEDFRKLQGSFEVLRALYQSKRIKTFLVPEVFDDDGDNDPFEGFDFDEDFDHESGDAQTQTPSWAYYKEAAASEDEPGYRVEPAKSGRGKCHQTTKGAKKCEDGSKIPKGAVRIGSLDQMSGAYARWVRLGCWWVPSRVWLGLDGLFQPLFVPPTTKRGKGHYVSSPTRPRGDNDDDVGSGDGDGENNESESSTTATITVVQVRRDFDPDEIRIALRALERMEDVVLSGFAALSDDQKLDFVKHVLDHEHHARLNKNHLRDLETIEAEATPKAVEEDGKVRAELEPSAAAAAAATASALSVPVAALSAALPSPNESANASQALAKTKQGFVVPRPGIDGIQGALESKRFVLTGIFPEIGGGCGLNLGKDKVKAMIESFGGRVTSAVSGKTDALICGKEPGASKVSKARSRKIPIFGLHELKSVCQGEKKSLEDTKPAVIANFSTGYYGRNNLALKMSEEDLENLRKPSAASASVGSASASTAYPSIEAEPDSTINENENKKPTAAVKKKKRKTQQRAATAGTKKKNKKKTGGAPLPHDVDLSSNVIKEEVVARPKRKRKTVPLPSKKKKKKNVAVEAAGHDGIEIQARVARPRRKRKTAPLPLNNKKSVAVVAVGTGYDGAENEAPKIPLDDLDNLKLVELKELCKSNGVQASGTKAIIKKRLRIHATSLDVT